MSAYEIPGFKLGVLKASADLSAKQYYAVKLTSSSGTKIAVPSASSDDIIGILQNAPASGEAAEVTISGVTKMLLGETVALGAKVQSDATGKGVNAGAGRVIGRALEAGVSGDIVPVLLLGV